MKKTFVTLAIFAGLLSIGVSCKKAAEWKPQPPYSGMEVPLKSFAINAQTDTMLQFANGTSIFVPQNCFVKSNGDVATGDVDIFYREFHDAIDILLAGIHMEFESMGETRHFRTAGMFEIDARLNGEKLSVAQGKKIDIRLASKYAGSDYSFFYMNPQSGAWDWIDLPETEVNTEKAEAFSALQTQKPSLFMGNEYFVLSFGRFLDIYLNNDWQKIRENRESKSIKRKLEDYKVKMYNAVAYGEVLFGKSYYHPQEILWKDLDGKAIPKWTSDFRINWDKDSNGKWVITNHTIRRISGNVYEIMYSRKDEVFKKRMEAVIPLKNLLKLPAAEWQKRYDEAMVQLAEEQQRIDLMAETFRAFSINRLGVYNFDALMKMDEWFEILPTFTVSSTQTLYGDVVIVFGDNSGYIRLKPEQYNSMRINPESGHRIIMLMPGNELGLYPSDLFKGVNIEELRLQTKPPFTFAFESKKVNSAVELRNLLGF
jgi:hypothetical protein